MSAHKCEKGQGKFQHYYCTQETYEEKKTDNVKKKICRPENLPAMRAGFLSFTFESFVCNGLSLMEFFRWDEYRTILAFVRGLEFPH